MIKFSLFRTAKPRQFDYRPRYFDPEKERREERKKEILGAGYAQRYEDEGEAKNENYVPGQYLRKGGLRGQPDPRANYSPGKSVLRVLVILLLLLAAAWWLVTTESFQTFFEGWIAK